MRLVLELRAIQGQIHHYSVAQSETARQQAIVYLDIWKIAMSWTEDRIELLRALWDSGQSASQIAEKLSGGITRNAVIGKAHRLGLKARPSPVKSETSPRKAVQASVKAATKAAPTAPKPAAPAAPRTVAAAPKVNVPITPKPPQPVAPAYVGPSRNIASGPQPPSMPPAPPRRLVGKVTHTQPVKGKVTLLDLNEKVCRWPSGHPGEEDFHFCGKPVNPGTPYCLEHCAVAYQSQLPRKDRPGQTRPVMPNISRFRI
jgi:GcrA cell cycle regulator